MGATVTAYDPVAMTESKRIFGIDPRPERVSGNETNSVLNEIKKSLKGYIIFDGRNLYSPHHVKALGLEYFSIGRGGLT